MVFKKEILRVLNKFKMNYYSFLKLHMLMFKTKQKFCQNNINKNVLNRNRKKRKWRELNEYTTEIQKKERKKLSRHYLSNSFY